MNRSHPQSTGHTCPTVGWPLSGLLLAIVGAALSVSMHTPSVSASRGTRADPFMLGFSLPVSAAAPVQERTGWFVVLWGDDFRRTPFQGRIRYLFIDDQSTWWRLRVPPAIWHRIGSPLQWNRRRVRIYFRSAGPLGGPFLRTMSLEVIDIVPEPAPTVPAPAVPRRSSWVTILCRFADARTDTPEPVSFFYRLIGAEYPGLQHYWQEVSYDQVTTEGSRIVGWFNLPHPRSYYVPGQEADLDRLLEDCARLADPQIDFPQFDGINLVFNRSLDCCAWGGSSTFRADGQTRLYRVTWLPRWAIHNQRIWAHEMGHGFGMPHSSPYDSFWDVMSGGSCRVQSREFGCIGVHPIAPFKYLVGWIPASRVLTVRPPIDRQIHLTRLAQPPDQGFLLVRIPIPGTGGDAYTLESRMQIGYDEGVPGEAVIVHRTFARLESNGTGAEVIDGDNNGDLNDAGAMWQPGEHLILESPPLQIFIVRQAASGFDVILTSRPTFMLESCAPETLPLLLPMSRCTLRSVNQFHGNVTFRCTRMPPGGTCIFRPNPVSLEPGRTADTVLAVQIPLNLASGTYPVTIVATARGIRREITVYLHVP